jgi:hypothetical protein
MLLHQRAGVRGRKGEEHAKAVRRREAGELLA